MMRWPRIRRDLRRREEYIKMKKAFLIPVLAVLALLMFYLYSNYSFLFQPIATVECAKEDSACVRAVESNRIACMPSSVIIEGRDGIVLMVNITREGDKCVRTEKVVGSEKQESDYLLGHNVSCNYSLSQLDNASATACPGSIYDYVRPSGGSGSSGGAGGSTPSSGQGIPKLTCGIEDVECKGMIINYIDNCVASQTINTDLKWRPQGYWTELIKITRYPDSCFLYFEILNAVNLPPGVPTTIIGSSMSCNIPYSGLLSENLTASWCSGELYDYLYG
jgi:hypothetical protein